MDKWSNMSYFYHFYKKTLHIFAWTATQKCTFLRGIAKENQWNLSQKECLLCQTSYTIQYEEEFMRVLFNCNFLVPRCRHKTKSTDQVRFFFDKALARHKASNQEGQGKPLRSLTSHRRVNDLRGAPRPAWLRALCQAFCWVKKKKWTRAPRFCWIRHRYKEIIFWFLSELRPPQFIFFYNKAKKDKKAGNLSVS